MIGANMEPRQRLAEKQLLFVTHFLIDVRAEVDASFNFEKLSKHFSNME